jgi:hypothetical protein
LLNEFSFFVIIVQSGVTPINLEVMLTHALIPLTALIDLIVSGHQIDFLKHCAGTMLTTVGFSIFSFLFYISRATNCDGDNFIYPFLNWNDKMKAFMFCIVSTMMTWIVYTAIYYLCKLRMFIFLRLFRRSNDNYEKEIRALSSDDKMEQVIGYSKIQM